MHIFGWLKVCLKVEKAIVKEFAVYKYLKEIINIISGKCYSFYTLIVYPIKFNKN